jgi:MFS-type transporter involved in bile tolerance (Atg22 family)
MPSRSSISGLDLLSFLMADVRDGVGPYLSVFLKGGLQWQSGDIGIAMAASSIAAAISQIPADLLVDSVRAKRAQVVISGLVVGLRCLLVVCVPSL